MTEMTMNCSEVRAELPLFVGGDLEAPARDLVARHLEGCTPCAEALAAASEARAALVEHLECTASTPSASVWPGVREALRSERLVNTAPPKTLTPAAPPTPGRGRLLRLAPFAAAAAAVVALALIPQQEDLPSPQPVVGLEEPQAGNPETALAEVQPGGGLREVAPSESLGGRAGLFIEQPLLPPAPFQSSHLRMASYGQEPAQQAPVLDPAQLLRIRGIR